LFAAFWDSPESNLLERRLRLLLRNVVLRCGLSYRWNMYTGPFAEILEIDARAAYSDGSTESLPLPPRYEFRRFAFMLAHQRRGDFYQAFADYLARQLPRTAEGAVELMIVLRTATAPRRTGLRGRFDLNPGPAFHESVVARKTLS
jgi:hypothetical protein